MKLPCVLIHDLLPLYAEHLTSPETDALVAEHLQNCPDCRQALQDLRLPVPVQADAHADAPLKSLQKSLQKKSIRAAAAAVLAALCAVALLFWMGTACTPATAAQAQLWAYSKKENSANLCILEAQGEGVWLDVEGEFSWGEPQITVQAVRYRFPGVHRALTALAGTKASSGRITVSRTQSLTVVCADETRYYQDGQQVERFILRENPDGTTEYVYGTEQEYGADYQKG